jgi:hypothetical protein
MATCNPRIQNDILNTTNFSAWVSRITADIARVGALQDPKVDDINYLTYTIGQDIKDHQDCITSTANNSANVLGQAINDARKLESLNESLEQRKHDVTISHDRAQTARNPERDRGYYDGWFPISRPLKHYTIPILIAISLFLFSLSLFYLLSLFGFNISFMINLPAVITGPLVNYGSKTLYTSSPFIIMAVIIAILIGLTIYGFSKK